ncbi:MAG: hypothetical protein HC881_23405 [Leptolyngbyaceae cyanobacterium SL_7_1]|nr:hypothetical protein [Leptolyngbyaceae cyanobacterium SL_7_1]
MTDSHLSTPSNDSPRSRSTCRERLITGVLLTLAVSVTTTPFYSAHRSPTAQFLGETRMSLASPSHLVASSEPGLVNSLVLPPIELVLVLLNGTTLILCS